MPRLSPLIGCAVLLVGAGFVTWSYETIPRSDTTATHFDTIVVLGTPCELNGSPSPEQITRVAGGVREFKAGRSEHIIVSGGAAHNRFVEAECMARLAEQAGVPIASIELEGRSQNTIQNVFYSWQIMQRHGWKSAEVVSSPSHLPRTSLILSHYNGLGFAWCTSPAEWPRVYPWWKRALYYGYEAQGTTMLRWFGFRHTPFLPGS